MLDGREPGIDLGADVADDAEGVTEEARERGPEEPAAGGRLHVGQEVADAGAGLREEALNAAHG